MSSSEPIKSTLSSLTSGLPPAPAYPLSQTPTEPDAVLPGAGALQSNPTAQPGNAAFETTTTKKKKKKKKKKTSAGRVPPPPSAYAELRGARVHIQRAVHAAVTMGYQLGCDEIAARDGLGDLWPNGTEAGADPITEGVRFRDAMVRYELAWGEGELYSSGTFTWGARGMWAGSRPVKCVQGSAAASLASADVRPRGVAAGSPPA